MKHIFLGCIVGMSLVTGLSVSSAQADMLSCSPVGPGSSFCTSSTGGNIQIGQVGPGSYSYSSHDRNGHSTTGTIFSPSYAPLPIPRASDATGYGAPLPQVYSAPVLQPREYLPERR
jgi:hypothetical protein